MDRSQAHVRENGELCSRGRSVNDQLLESHDRVAEANLPCCILYDLACYTII